MKLPAAALDHRRFWQAMDQVGEAELAEIERRIVARMVEAFELDLSGLVLDMTNFATYIGSGNDRAPIAQRGHAKQKRADLRIIGLGLVVSTDGGVPLVSHAYPGNLPDVSQFKTMLDELVARFGALGGDAGQLTLVFDAGQNSADNFGLFEGSPLHFVGSLPPSDHLDLLTVAKSRYRPLDQGRFPGLSAFETKKAVFGTERRIVVTHSQTLHDRQSAGFDQTLAKAARQLGELQARLERGQTRRPREKVEAEDSRGPKAEMALTGHLCHPCRPGAGRPAPDMGHRPEARDSLEDELFGKRVLFTDKDKRAAPTAAIVADYRSQEAAEGDFHQLKDPKVVSFSPMFHWTEQKIRVHVFYCVLALALARLMVREADRHGLHLSVRELLGPSGRSKRQCCSTKANGGGPAPGAC